MLQLYSKRRKKLEEGRPGGELSFVLFCHCIAIAIVETSFSLIDIDIRRSSRSFLFLNLQENYYIYLFNFEPPPRALCMYRTDCLIVPTIDLVQNWRCLHR